MHARWVNVGAFFIKTFYLLTKNYHGKTVKRT